MDLNNFEILGESLLSSKAFSKYILIKKKYILEGIIFKDEKDFSKLKCISKKEESSLMINGIFEYIEENKDYSSIKI